MNITPLNTISYKSISFGEKKKGNSAMARAVVATDKALSKDIGLEMLSIMNSASLLAQKNNTTVKAELDKMASGLCAIKDMGGSEKTTKLATKILDMEFVENNEHQTRIDSQSRIIKDHIAFLSDILEDKNFIKFKNKALKTLSGASNSVIEANGFMGRMHADRLTIARTENTPGFDYYFSGPHSPQEIKISNYLTNNSAEEYVYTLNKDGKLDASAPIKVRQYEIFGSDREVTTSYAWNNDNGSVSVHCIDAAESH